MGPRFLWVQGSPRAAAPLPVRRILMLEPFRRVPGFDIAPRSTGGPSQPHAGLA